MPIKLQTFFVLSKLSNELNIDIIIAITFNPIPGIAFNSLYSFLKYRNNSFYFY